MIKFIFSIIKLFFVFHISNIECSKTLRDKIYYSVGNSDFNMCFRRFNLTNQIGCNSHRNGNIGTVLYIKEVSNLDKLNLPNDYAPYIIILDLQLFENTIILKLLYSKLVNGIIISRTNQSDFPQNFSSDLKSPNSQFGLYKNDAKLRDFIWNEVGNELMYKDIDIPISIVTNQTVIQFIINDCYEKFNAEYFGQGKTDVMPRCSIRMKDDNHGAQNTQTCWRRSNLVLNLNPETYCFPIGSHNVHAYLNVVEKNQTFDNNSVILLIARLDSYSMFEKSSPGMDSAVSGFIALHAIAEALSEIKDKFTTNSPFKNILFLFLNGESFDYSGSIKLVYDIRHKKFAPLSLDSIGAIIEIGQIGCHEDEIYLYNEQYKVWLHTDPISRPHVDNKVKVLKDKLKKIGSYFQLDVSEVPDTQPLPPSSIQTFLKHRLNIPSIYISNHQNIFSNKFYNSYFDEMSQSGLNYPANMSNEDRYNYDTHLSKKIYKLSISVATLIARIYTNDEDVQISSNISTINHLLFCFTVDPACKLFNESLIFGSYSDNLHKEDFFQHYVGVYFDRSVNPQVQMHLLLLVYHLGTPTFENKSSCIAQDGGDEHFYLNGAPNFSNGVCMKCEAGLSSTISPAFENQEWEKYSEFPAWTESKWAEKSFQIDVFVVPLKRDEAMMLALGLTLTLISLPIIIISKKSFKLKNAIRLNEI